MLSVMLLLRLESRWDLHELTIIITTCPLTGASEVLQNISHLVAQKFLLHLSSVSSLKTFIHCEYFYSGNFSSFVLEVWGLQFDSVLRLQLSYCLCLQQLMLESDVVCMFRCRVDCLCAVTAQ